MKAKSGAGEGIHLAGLGRHDPFTEYYRQATQLLTGLAERIEQSAATALAALDIAEAEHWDSSQLRPAATWTYMVNDRVVSSMARLLQGAGNFGVAAGSIVATPHLFAWGAWQILAKKLGRGRGARTEKPPRS